MMKGIDVSKHQAKIDWAKVKKSGIDFAIIRAGYGTGTPDPYFYKNIDGALENGLKVGVYWFIYGDSVESAEKNAEMCHKIICDYKDKLTLKVWADYEYDSDRYALDKGISTNNFFRTSMVVSFCERMKKLGYDVGVYANTDYLKNKFDAEVKRYPLWLAQYANKKSYDCFMWQYTDTGKVDGVNGNCDMNYCYEELNESIPDLTGFVGGSIVKALSEKGYESSFKFRKVLWGKIGMTDKYKGTAEQNHALIVLLGGKVQTDIPSLSGYKGFSIVSGLKSFGYPYDFEYRKMLWSKIGKTDTYKGTAYQNLTLLNTLKSV